MADHEETSSSSDELKAPESMGSLRQIAQTKGELAFAQAVSAQITYGEQKIGRALQQPVGSLQRFAGFEAAHRALYEVCNLRERAAGIPQIPWEDDVRAAVALADLYVISGRTFGAERGFKLTDYVAIANHLYTFAYRSARRGTLADQLSVSQHAERGMLAANDTAANITWHATSTGLYDRIDLADRARAVLYKALHQLLPQLDATPTVLPDPVESAVLQDPLAVRKSIETGYLREVTE